MAVALQTDDDCGVRAGPREVSGCSDRVAAIVSLAGERNDVGKCDVPVKV